MQKACALAFRAGLSKVFEERFPQLLNWSLLLGRGDELTHRVQFHYADMVVRETAGVEKKCQLEYGFRKGKLPVQLDVEFALALADGVQVLLARVR